MEDDQSITEFFKLGWELWMNNFGRLVGPVVVWMIWLGIVPGVELGFFGGTAELIGRWLFQLIAVFLELGVVKLLLDIYDSNQFKLENAIFNNRVYLNLIAYSILLFLISEFTNIVIGATGKVGLIVIICLAIYLYLRLFFVEYLIIDQHKQVLEAVSLSWVMTEEVIGQLFLFVIVALIICILGVLPGFILGLVFVSVPVVTGAKVCFYRYLV